MATLSAAMVTLLTDNWAGAGAAPTFGALIDYQKDLADTTEQVIVRLPIHEDVDPINDIYSNFKYTIQLRVKSTVSEDRLKVLTDEVIRILNTYAITGISRQFAKRGENTSDRRRQIYSYDVWANLEEHVSTGGTAYASPGAGDVVFPAGVEITGTLGIGTAPVVNYFIKATKDYAGDLRVRFAQEAVHGLFHELVCAHATGYCNYTVASAAQKWAFGLIETDGKFRVRDETNSKTLFTVAANTGDIGVEGKLTTATQAQIDDLLMFGSANATWVPCSLDGWNPTAGGVVTNLGQMSNVDNTTLFITYICPLPPLRGALKLYVKGTRIHLDDADAGDYITNTKLEGMGSSTGRSDLDTDPTDKNAVQLWPDAFTAVDCSSYSAIKLRLQTVCANAGDLKINNVELHCYYAA